MIQLGNGVKIGEKFVLDGNSKNREKIISHAHFDHLTKQDANIISSQQTAAIAEKRTNNEFQTKQHPKIDLINAGHIIGSKAALIKHQNKKILYTGDFSTRDRLYLKGFQPPNADILIIESTYGIPEYQFPSFQEIEEEILNYIANKENPLFLFGYSLGKAQKIQKIAEKTNKPVYISKTVAKMNKVIEKVTDLEFKTEKFEKKKLKPEKDSIYICSSNNSNLDSLNKKIEDSNGEKVGFSGWAVGNSFQYRGGYDRTFPLSDHADFNELIETVEKVNPNKVYTLHGYSDRLASYLRNEKNITATSLKKHQSNLNHF